MAPVPVLPDYGGACIASVIPALLDGRVAPSWLPAPAATARQRVLLVLDGLGWEQLQERSALAPALSSMTGGPITSVAPSTTATALTSITTGSAPAQHGIVGYQVRVGEGVGEVLNILTWRTSAGDARPVVVPEEFITAPPYPGTTAAVVTHSAFTSSGFTRAFLAGARMNGWSVPSTLVVEVGRLLAVGELFVYAYYDGIDKIAHERGFGAYYDAELAFVDRMVGEILDGLPAEAALVVTADHGQVMVGDRCEVVAPDLMNDVQLVSGEARFRWLHARPEAADRLLVSARERYADRAWVMSREEVVAAGWFGGPLAEAVAARLGDVAIVAHAPIGLLDPGSSNERILQCRHGSLTAAEMFVPLLAGSA